MMNIPYNPNTQETFNESLGNPPKFENFEETFDYLDELVQSTRESLEEN